MSCRVQAVTIICLLGYADAWALNEKDLNQLTRFIRRLFKKYAADAIGVIVLDISFNLAANINGEDHWQIHFHCMIGNVSNQEWANIREFLRKNSGRRSLYLEEVYNPIGQLAYMAKPNFSLRESYIDKKGELNSRNNTLTIDHELELAEWLASYKVHSRIVKIGQFGDEVEK